MGFSRFRAGIALRIVALFVTLVAAAAMMALISFPAVPFRRLRSNLCSFFRCPMLGSTAARRFIHRHRACDVCPLRLLSTCTVTAPS